MADNPGAAGAGAAPGTFPGDGGVGSPGPAALMRCSGIAPALMRRWTRAGAPGPEEEGAAGAEVAGALAAAGTALARWTGAGDWSGSSPPPAAGRPGASARATACSARATGKGNEEAEGAAAAAPELAPGAAGEPEPAALRRTGELEACACTGAVAAVVELIGPLRRIGLIGPVGVAASEILRACTRVGGASAPPALFAWTTARGGADDSCGSSSSAAIRWIAAGAAPSEARRRTGAEAPASTDRLTSGACGSGAAADGRAESETALLCTGPGPAAPRRRIAGCRAPADAAGRAAGNAATAGAEGDTEAGAEDACAAPASLARLTTGAWGSVAAAGEGAASEAALRCTGPGPEAPLRRIAGCREAVDVRAAIGGERVSEVERVPLEPPPI